MLFGDNKVLFGYDFEERLVAVELAEDGSVLLFSRDDTGQLSQRNEPFRPFFWSAEPPGLPGGETTQLDGTLPFRFITHFDTPESFAAARKAAKVSPQFLLNDPVQQYLVQSGKTLFKGMQFDHLHRLQIHIETFCPDGSQISCAQNASDHLMAVALTDNCGLSEFIMIDPSDPEPSEAAALHRLSSIIGERDPDVIEGHELFRMVLPYLVARAKRLKLTLLWGRNKRAVSSRASRIQIAEKTINYPKFQIFGRHLVDSFLLAQLYDVGARELEGFTLEDVASHFRFGADETKPTREAQQLYLNDAPAFARHAEARVKQIGEVTALLSASYFVQAQIFPYNYRDVVVRGNATRIDALFLREYYRRRHSLPELPVPRPFEGGYTDLFHTGVARNVWHCDVASLYPSVMLQFGYVPEQDELGIFHGLLSDLRRFRLEAKRRMREATGPAKDEFSALQSTFKILINSFYGYLGFAQGHFADFAAASRVTETGRDLLKAMVAWLQERGAKVIEIDTDGIYFVPAEGQTVEELHEGLVKSVLPEGIDVEFDTRFAAMFSYKAKNYALLHEDGTMVVKGGALKSRGLEKFQRVFIEKILLALMNDMPERVEEVRAKFERKIRNREWPVEMLMKTDTLQDSLVKYSQKVAASARNRSAAYELALRSPRRLQPGDQISYYITGTKKTDPAYENCQMAADWDPAARNENVEYYVAKLNDLAKKFAPFVQEQGRLL